MIILRKETWATDFSIFFPWQFKTQEPVVQKFVPLHGSMNLFESSSVSTLLRIYFL